MPLTDLINIVDSTLVYTVVIYHIFTFNKCTCRIYNDIINYCWFTKCQHACVRVYICNCKFPVLLQAFVVIGIHSAFLRITSYSVTILIFCINSFCHSFKLICAVFFNLIFLSYFPSLALKIIANTSSSLEFS